MNITELINYFESQFDDDAYDCVMRSVDFPLSFNQLEADILNKVLNANLEVSRVEYSKTNNYDKLYNSCYFIETRTLYFKDINKLTLSIDYNNIKSQDIRSFSICYEKSMFSVNYSQIYKDYFNAINILLSNAESKLRHSLDNIITEVLKQSIQELKELSLKSVSKTILYTKSIPISEIKPSEFNNWFKQTNLPDDCEFDTEIIDEDCDNGVIRVPCITYKAEETLSPHQYQQSIKNWLDAYSMKHIIDRLKEHNIYFKQTNPNLYLGQYIQPEDMDMLLAIFCYPNVYIDCN
jgi:hypothetical protein